MAEISIAISQVQNWIEDANDSYSSEQQKLRDVELELSTVAGKIDSTREQLAFLQSEITVLNTQLETLATEKTEQEVILAQLIRSAYINSSSGGLKTLLNQEDISEASRMLHYNKVFSEQQLASIESFKITMNRIATSESELQSKASELSQQESTLAAQIQAMDESKNLRESAQAELSASIATRSGELEQLEMNRIQLEELIEQINQAMESIKSVAELQPFAELRNSLPSPVEGETIHRFGSSMGFDQNGLSRQGLSIAVNEGTPVRAVQDGRIVFSDWLRGLGLLVIIDHGDGYMSLYGANQALSKTTGEWIKQGDVLSTSGTIGEDKIPGVYFEIRHHGQPQDPESWLQIKQ